MPDQKSEIRIDDIPAVGRDAGEQQAVPPDDAAQVKAGFGTKTSDAILRAKVGPYPGIPVPYPVGT